MEIPKIPTLDDVKTSLKQIENDEFTRILTSGDINEYFSTDEKIRKEYTDAFVSMTTIVHRYLCAESIGRGYKPENKPAKISDMFCHHMWSMYSLSEAMETLYKKGKRDKNYVDEFMRQFAHDTKEILDFCEKIANGELPDSIRMYNSRKLKTYTAVQDGLFYTKIKVT